MQRRVQRTQKSQSQPKSKTEKVVREVGPRREEVIQTVRRKNEYMDNFSYHETKDLKRNNPRYFVVVEHTRKGDIFGDGNFEKTSYERQVYSQGGNRPKLEGNDRLRGKKPAQPAASQQVTKKTTRTTTSNTRKQNPVSATATNEKIQQTTMKRRNEGTVSKTESRTETKTTTSGVRGQKKDSTTSKTTTRTTTQKPAEGKTQTTTTKTTKTTTTRTRGRV